MTYVVDDHGHGGDIDSTGEDVGRDKDLGLSVAEFVNDLVTLLAFNTTSQGRHGVTFFRHPTFNLSSGRTGLNKC